MGKRMQNHTPSSEKLKQQNERFKIFMNHLESIGLYESNIQLANEVGINRSYLSTVINGGYSPYGVASRICEHFNLPYLTWIDTGEGIAPMKQFSNGSKYIGYLDEGSEIETMLSQGFTPIVLPKNILCEIVFVYRGKMYFVNKHDTFHRITDSGIRYFIELDNGQKIIKRLSEKTVNDRRVITFIEPDNSIPNFDMQISNINSIYRIIATLEFNQ